MSVFTSGYGNPAGFSTAYIAPTPAFTPALAPQHFGGASTVSCAASFPPAPLNDQGFIGQMFQLMQQVLQMMGTLLGGPLVTGSPGVRSRLGDANPDSPTVAVIDSFKPGPDGGSHGQDVSGVIAGGVPASDIQRIDKSGFAQADLSRLSEARTATEYVRILAEEHVSSSVDDVSGALERILGNPQSDIRTVNMSVGPTNSTTYEFLLDVLTKPENEPLLKQFLSEQGVGDRPKGHPDRGQALLDLVDRTIEESPVVRRSLDRYNRNTAIAEEAGIAITVAAANHQDWLEEARSKGLRMEADDVYNLLAQNPHVIAVGAIDDKNNGNAADDTIAEFSSMGDARFHPLILADGVEVNGDKDLSGTSFSAPSVARLIEQMRRINPNLTVAEIKEMLARSASHRVAGLPVAGFDAALELARQSVA